MNIKLITLAQAKKIVAHVNDLIKTKIDTFKQEFGKRPTYDSFIAGKGLGVLKDEAKGVVMFGLDSTSTNFTLEDKEKLDGLNNYDTDDWCDDANDSLEITAEKIGGQDTGIEVTKSLDNNENKIKYTIGLSDYAFGIVATANTINKVALRKDKIGEGLTIKDDKLCSKLLTKDTQLTQDELMSFDRHIIQTHIVNSLAADINILKEFKLRLETPDVFYLQAEASFLSGYENAQVICTDKNKNILSKLDFYTIQVIPTKRYDGVLSAYVIKDDNNVTIHVNRTITGDILDVRLNIIAYSNV